MDERKLLLVAARYIVRCSCEVSVNDGNVLYKKITNRKEEKEIGEYRKIGQIFLQLIDCYDSEGLCIIIYNSK